MIFHKHHLIPKHAGGDNSSSNLVKVNIAMHAFLHRLRYAEKGDIRDLKAAEGLLKIKTKQEIVRDLTLLSRRFSDKTHTEDTKDSISSSMTNNWKTRDKTQIINLGKSSHKRNTAPGRKVANSTGHPYKRKHWPEELYLEVQARYLGRTSFHWGKTELSRKYNVPVKTIENMIKHVKEGKTYQDLTANERE